MGARMVDARQRVQDMVRRLGLADATLFVVARALERVSGGRARLAKYHFLAQPVPARADARLRPAGITVVELGADDARRHRMDRPRAEIERRFAAGARCFCAWQGDTLTGFLWFTAGGYDEDEVRCTFRIDPRASAVWDLDVHIEPRFRLGRTFALLWESAFDAMRELGVRWSLSRVSAFNAESIRAHQRLGARRTGWAIFFLVGSWQFTLSSQGGLKCRSLKHGPYPVLEIRAPDDEPREGERGACETPSAADACPPADVVNQRPTA